MFTDTFYVIHKAINWQKMAEQQHLITLDINITKDQS